MEHQTLRFGVYTLDLADARLLRDGEVVPLPPKALAVLNYLLERRGTLVDKDELLDAVWGRRFVSEGVLKNTIQILRQALEDDPKAPRYIETAHRLGYRFIAEVAAGQPRVSTIPPSLLPPAPLLVGRADLLAELGHSLDKAVRSEPQIVFLSGEPGIGKTALIEAFVHANAARAPTGRGQCVEQYGQGEPYLPVLEALNDLIKRDEGRLRPLLRQVAPTWLAQLPWYMGADDHAFLQQTVAGASQMRMLREFGELMSRYTAVQPLILVLEDLHWSDHATLDLLAYLARRRQPARWLLLGSYRPEDVLFNGHPLRHVGRELQIQGLCRELPLALLSETAIGEYLAHRFPERSSLDSWARTLHARTGGLPFFLVQVIEAVQDEDDRNDTLPEGVQQLLERQFERLPAGDRAILEAAGVVGMSFSAEAVAATLDLDPAAIEEGCGRLARLRQFIQPAADEPCRYGFRHAFYREFAYGRLSPLQRTRLHLRVGIWLEKTGTRPGELAAELALHFEQGKDWEKAVHYLQQAAVNAMTRHALHEAAQLLRHGLSILEIKLANSAEFVRYGADMYIQFAMVLQATQGYSVADLQEIYARALDLAQQLGKTPRLPKVLWGLWAFHFVQLNLHLSLHYARNMHESAEQAGDTAGLIGAQVAQASTLLTCGELESALAYSRSALALYDPAVHGDLLYVYGQDLGIGAKYCEAQALWQSGFADQSMESYRQLLMQAGALGHPYTLSIALSGSVMQRVDRREPERVLEHCNTLENLSAEHGFILWQAMAAIMRGWALALLNHADEGLSMLHQGLASWRATGSRIYESRFLALLAEAQARNGRPDLGLASLAEALSTIEHCGERYYEAEVHRLYGELLLQTGSHDLNEVEDCFRKAIAVARAQQARFLELRAAASLGEFLLAQHRHNEAYDLLSKVHGWFSEGFDTPDLRDARKLLAELAGAAVHSLR